MPSTLIVEDGTGLLTADTYVDWANYNVVYPTPGTVDGADTYWGKHGSPVEWTGATQATKEAALRYATLWLDGVFRWRGLLSKFNQRLGWPRVLGYQYVDTFDEQGRVLQGVPERIAWATCEAALAHIKVQPLNVVQTAQQTLLKEVHAGPVGVTYQDFGSGGVIPQPTYRYIAGLLRGMYISSTLGGTGVVRLARA